MTQPNYDSIKVSYISTCIFLSLCMSIYPLTHHPHRKVDESKVWFLAKPNLKYALGFNMYTRLYYIITHYDLLKNNTYPLSRVQKLISSLFAGFCYVITSVFVTGVYYNGICSFFLQFGCCF